MNKLVSSLLVPALAVVTLAACHTPQAGPDKTLGGAVLGAAWGAGSGAIVGNQLGEGGQTGAGAGIGAGLGAVAGAAAGLTYDAVEDTQLEHDKQLASLKMQNTSNARELARLQDTLDRATEGEIAGGVYQVYFDEDATSLRAGAVANLEVIAESIKMSTSAYVINVVGNTDDTGTPDYNKRVAEARARAVSAYLGARGISMDQIRIQSFGSERPIASNATPVGRQLNRRVDVYISKR